MKGYQPTTFGELHAEEYDELHDPGTTAASVELIADLAGDGKLFELAIGTGRVALPLVARGLDVHGLEVSEAMVAKLRQKPSGEAVPVMIGDMASFETDERYDFAFLVFNTLFNLTSQNAQIGCFQSVARCLNKGGQFLVETFVPDVARYENHQNVSVKKLDAETLWLDTVTHDPVNQVLNHQRIRYEQGASKLVPLPMRYAWPSEIDLMARLAGMKLIERWGGWHREPFTADSKMHVSLYEKSVQ